MAKFIPELVNFVLSSEGGIANNKNDTGGLTNKGLTFTSYHELCKKVLGLEPSLDHFNKLADVDIAQFVRVYWIEIRGDEIDSQPIAEYICDWDWGSGKWARENVQIAVKCKPDGIIGKDTIQAINTTHPRVLLDTLLASRLAYYDRIVALRPSQAEFIHGWKNRSNSQYSLLLKYFI